MKNFESPISHFELNHPPSWTSEAWENDPSFFINFDSSMLNSPKINTKSKSTPKILRLILIFYFAKTSMYFLKCKDFKGIIIKLQKKFLENSSIYIFIIPTIHGELWKKANDFLEYLQKLQIRNLRMVFKLR